MFVCWFVLKKQPKTETKSNRNNSNNKKQTKHTQKATQLILADPFVRYSSFLRQENLNRIKLDLFIALFFHLPSSTMIFCYLLFGFHFLLLCYLPLLPIFTYLHCKDTFVDQSYIQILPFCTQHFKMQSFYVYS